MIAFEILFAILLTLKLFSCSNFYQQPPPPQPILLKNNEDYVASVGGSGQQPLFSYLGCFNDRKEDRDINEKDFSYVTKFNKTIPTVELCISMCAEHGYKIVGIQAFDECYCGNTYGRYKAASNSSCFFQCAGKYSCGGYNSNSVYLITNPSKSNKPSSETEKLTLNIASPCASSPCLNSGVCITLIDDKGLQRGYKCKCTNPQDSGIYCEDRNYCHSNPCMNSGVCLNTYNGYTCKCSGNWTGLKCNFPISKKVLTDCLEESKKCLNGGSCLKTLNELHYSCKCPPNFTGKSCEIPNPSVCDSNPCKNKGKCVQLNQNSYECKCVGDYVGTHCERFNYCANVSCGHGVCMNVNQGYSCTCDNNFTGAKCDTCVKGYQGEHCNELITFCSSNPCVNGICIYDAMGFKCICSEGWKGKNCNEKNCLLNPCLNDGVCKGDFDEKNKRIEYYCSCPKGYYGNECEYLEVDPCVSSPCRIDEDCVRNKTTYTCIKSISYCQKKKLCNENSECVYSELENKVVCKCLNGAAQCVLNKNKQKYVHLNDILVEYDNMTEALNSSNSSSPSSKSDKQFDTITVGNYTTNSPIASQFNHENLYWILPLALFSFVMFFFVTFVLYFGMKAKNRTAKLSSSNKSTYIDDNLTFDKTINKSPSLDEPVNSVTYLTSNSIRETPVPTTTVQDADSSNSNSSTSCSANCENGPV